MAIETASFPIKNGDFPSFILCLPEGISSSNYRSTPGTKGNQLPQWLDLHCLLLAIEAGHIAALTDPIHHTCGGGAGPFGCGHQVVHHENHR